MEHNAGVRSPADHPLCIFSAGWLNPGAVSPCAGSFRRFVSAVLLDLWMQLTRLVVHSEV